MATAKRILKQHTGKVVANDGASLAELLEVEALSHQGNFNFTASLDGTPIVIYTQPADEDGDTIIVTAVYDMSPKPKRQEPQESEWTAEEEQKIRKARRGFIKTAKDLATDKSTHERVERFVESIMDLYIEELIAQRGGRA